MGKICNMFKKKYVKRNSFQASSTLDAFVKITELSLSNIKGNIFQSIPDLHYNSNTKYAK